MVKNYLFGFSFYLLTGCVCLYGQYSGGNGTVSDPWQIASAEDLVTLGQSPEDYCSNFILVADIDLKYIPFMSAVIAPIRYDPNSGYVVIAFSGVFDGNSKCIYNLTIDTLGDSDPVNDDANYLGLFGQCSQAVIKNLTIKNGSVNGGNSSYVGGLCGYNEASHITRCLYEGEVKGNVYSDNIGGLVGYSTWLWFSDDYLEEAKLEYCGMIGCVTGGYRVGGLVGQCGASETIACFANTTTTGVDSVGGLLGEYWSHVAIANCYALGQVTGESSVGGLIGYSQVIAEDKGISNCYSACKVNGDYHVGGFIGYAENEGVVHNCFWDIDISGIGDSSGSEGKTTDEMHDSSTFINAGWDFVRPIWGIQGQDYPKLAWNNPDIDNNSIVNWNDLAQITAQWLLKDCGWCDNSDLTGDLAVDIFDLNYLVNRWLDIDQMSDHIFSITIGVGHDYSSPNDDNDTEYNFELKVMTDNTVDHIDFITTSNHSVQIPKRGYWASEGPDGNFYTDWDYNVDLNAYEWSYEAELFNLDDLQDYDTSGYGEYEIIIYYQNGHIHSVTIPFGVPETTNPLPQPVQIPLLIEINDGDYITTPESVAWEPWSACNSLQNSLIYFGLDHDESGEEFKYLLKCEDGVSEMPHLHEGEWESSLAFAVWYDFMQNNVPVSIYKYTESDYDFIIIP